MDYGCGIGLKSAKWATKDWEGMNICGNLLMKVRDELVGKIDMGDMSIDEIAEAASSQVSEKSDVGETIMETKAQIHSNDSPKSLESSKADKSVVADNTLVEIASQTMALPDEDKINASNATDDDGEGYNTNFPYLERAKSPPAPTARVFKPHLNTGQGYNSSSTGNRQVNIRNNSYNCAYKKARPGKGSSSQSTISTSTAAPSSTNLGQSSSVGSNVPNKASIEVDDFIEILNKKKNYSHSQTSTPSAGRISKQQALEMKLNRQNKGLRKAGLEPSSDFVKNIMDNHSF